MVEHFIADPEVRGSTMSVSSIRFFLPYFGFGKFFWEVGGLSFLFKEQEVGMNLLVCFRLLPD